MLSSIPAITSKPAVELVVLAHQDVLVPGIGSELTSKPPRIPLPQSQKQMRRQQRQQQQQEQLTNKTLITPCGDPWPRPYIIDNGLRRVAPYFFTYHTYCKERWRGRGLLDIFTSEFRDRSEDYYVCEDAPTCFACKMDGLNLIKSTGRS